MTAFHFDDVDGGTQTPVPDKYELTELISQAFEDCVISAGGVVGHPTASVYVQVDRTLTGFGSLTLYLTPPEITALAWCATGVTWSAFMQLWDELCDTREAASAGVTE